MVVNRRQPIPVPQKNRESNNAQSDQIKNLRYHGAFIILAENIDMSISRRALGLCSFVLFNLMTGAANAADWWFVPQERVSEDLLYIDKSSLERPGRGSRVSAWVWVVFKSDRPSEKGGYRSEKRHLIVDCDKSLASADAVFRYSTYGGLVSQSRNPIEALSQIEATPTDGVACRFMCSGGKQPIRSIPVYEPNKDSEQRFWLKERENVAPASR